MRWRRGVFLANETVMKRLRSHNVGVDQGSVVMFEDFEHDGPMWTGDGPREQAKEVAFSDVFREVPVVQVTLSMWDTDSKTNQRMDISARDVTETGFTAVFKTWGDSRVARVRVDWIAIGPLEDELDWDVR